MDLSEFSRVAPRYVDGEANADERRAIERRLLSDADAQAELDFFDREARWIDRALKRAPQDISGVVIRVRRRNPYRRLHLSPFAALGLQFALLLGMAALVLKLATELAPPRFELTDLVGTVSVEQQPLAHDAGGIPLNRPISAAERSQARFQIGAMDSVLLNHNSVIRLLPPRDDIRHVIEVEAGEVWVRMIDQSSRFRIHFGGTENLSISGSHAELNVVYGLSMATAMAPRGYTATDKERPLALVRVIEGNAYLNGVEASGVELRSGEAWAITEEHHAVRISDPDAQDYTLLRLDRNRRFKQHWEWLELERFPLSREVVTYDLWKSLVDIADRITERRHRALDRDGHAEVSGFRKTIRANLAQALNRHGMPEPSERDRIRSTLGERNPAVIEADAERMHIDRDNAWFLLTLTGEVNELLNAWEEAEAQAKTGTISDMIDRDMLALGQSQDMSGALKVLANLESEVATRLARTTESSGPWAAILAAVQFVVTSAADHAKASALLGEHEASEFRDLDGSKLRGIDMALQALRTELASLEALMQELEFLKLALRPVDQRIEALQTTLAPIRAKYDASTAERTTLSAALAINTFDAERLARAEADVTAQTRREQELVTAIDALHASITAKDGEIERRGTELDKIGAALVTARTQRQAIDTDIFGAAELHAGLQIGLGQAQQALADELAYFAGLGSAEKAQPAAQLRVEEARARVVAIEKDVAAAHAKLNVLTDQAAAKSDEIAGLEGQRGEHEQLQIDARAKRAASQTLLTSNETELAATRQALVSTTSIRDDQLRARTEREDLVRRITDLDGELGPLGKQVAELEARIATEYSDSAATRAKYDTLFAQTRRVPEIEGEQRRLQELADRYTGTEELIRKTRIDLLVAQNEWLADLVLLGERHLGYARMLGATLVAPDKVDELVAERAPHLELALNAALDTAARDGSVRSALALGDTLVTAWKDFIAQAERSNLRFTEQARAQRLAYAYIRALALAGENEILEANFRDVYDFKRYRDSLSGFDRPPASDEASAAKALLAAAGETPYDLPDFTPAQREALLRAQWELFSRADAVAERDRRIAASKGEPIVESESRECYLSLLRLDPKSRQVRNFGALWQHRLMDKSLLSDAQRTALQTMRLSPAKDPS